MRLRHLVRERWFASRPFKTILKRYGFWQANRRNDHWYCTHLSRMFVLAATAAGFQARILNVARQTGGDENCFGHMVVDIWSNQYQRWIYMDPLFDFHYEDESSKPLSALQARSLYFRNDARGLYLSTLRNRREITPGRYPLARPHLDEVTKSLHVRSSNLFWCLYYHGQNYFRQPVEQRQVPILRFRDDLNRHSRLTSEGVELYIQEPMLEDTEAALDVEPMLNNAEIQICRSRGQDDAVAYVATQMPNLRCIRYRVNGSRWRRYDVDGVTFALPRHGETKLEAQAMSQMGQRSLVSEVVLRSLK